MRRLLIVLVFSLLSINAAAATVWSAGLGMESRLQREVNPDYADMHNIGTLYAKARFWPLAVLLEAEQQERDSHSGDLRIRSDSTQLGLWGRYEFRDPEVWSPFVGLGIGTSFDRVRTSFGDDQDTRRAQRHFMGTAAGLTKTFWKHMLTELEARATLMERRDQYFLSGLIRIGFTY
jgi:hypothetical protein